MSLYPGLPLKCVTSIPWYYTGAVRKKKDSHEEVITTVGVFQIMGIYDYINSINGNKKVLYVFVVVAVAFGAVVFLDPMTANGVIGILIGLAVVYYLNDQAITSTEDLDSDLYYKLQTLGQVNAPSWTRGWPLGNTTTLPEISFNSKYMYLDADIVNLLDSIKNDIGATNLDNYLNTLRCVENVMHMKSDFESVDLLSNAYESYQIAEAEAKAALNYANGFAIAFLDASPVLRRKHKAFMKRFQLLLQRNLDQMKKKANQVPLNTTTHFITDFNGPVAIEKATGFSRDYAGLQFNIY